MIDPIEARFAALVAALQPAARKQLTQVIARQLRATQSKRIAAQRTPDGSAFEPRKPQLRARKKNLRAGMFAKLRTARLLKASATPDAAVIAFAAEVQRIARVHHFGLRDRVDRRNRVEADYPARPLLGLSDGDEQFIESLLINTLSAVL